MRDRAGISGFTKLTSLAALALVACQDGSAPTAPQVESPRISAAIVPAEGVAVEVFRTDVQPDGQQGPIALAFDSEGNLYVATGGFESPPFNRRLKILKIPAGTNNPQEFGVPLIDPDGVVVDSEGNIIVSANRVTKFNPAGGVISRSGSTPSPWQVICPIGNIQLVTVDADDNIYVGSLGTEICKIPPDGLSFQLLGSFVRPSEPAVSPDGFLYVALADEAAANIVKASLDGTILDNDVASGLFAQPTFAPSGDLFVGIGSGVGVVQKIEIPGGSQTPIASGFSSPRGLAFAPDGTLFVADDVDKVIYRISLPQEQLQALIQGIAALNTPGTPEADKLEDVRAKLQTTVDELEKTPPDNQAALGTIEGAVGDLQAAVDDGQIDAPTGTDLMDQLSGIARQIAANAIDQAVACDSDNSDIADAERALDDGDTERAAGNYKDAVNKYKDALAKAEGVVASCP